MGNVCQGLNVTDFCQRIAGRFGQQQLGVGLDGIAPLLNIGLRDEGCLDTKLAKLGLQQGDGRAKHALRANDVIPCLEQGHHGQQDGAHAAGRGNAGLGAFKRSQAALEHHRGRVGEARVNKRFFFVGKTCCRRGRIGVVEATGQEQCFRVLVPLRGRQTFAHCQRFDVRIGWQVFARQTFFRVRRGHGALRCRQSGLFCKAKRELTASSSPF